MSANRVSGPTPSQTIGPFFSFGMSWNADGLVVPEATSGALVISGRVLDGEGASVPDAMVEVFQSPPAPAAPLAQPAPTQPAPAQQEVAWRGFGRCMTDAEGCFRFVTVKPAGVPGSAPHLEVSVFARGLLQRLWTRIYFPDEVEANHADPVLASAGPRAFTLVAQPEAEQLRFDIRLQGAGRGGRGGEETVFFAW